MTRTSTMRLRAAALAATAGATLVAVLAAAPAANAAFTSPECGGSATLDGAGASFQNSAHSGVFKPEFVNTLCGGSGPTITYPAGGLTGSGAGQTAMGARLNNPNGARNATVRFGGTDEPLSTGVKGEINQGTDAAGDEGQIHQIPIAAGAIVPIVNFPDGCNVETIPTANQTAPRNAGELDAAYNTRVQFTNRARFTRAQLEAIMAGDGSSDTWGELFPTLAAIPGNTAGPGGTFKDTAACVGQQVTRVVRFDVSGSTFAFKDALNKYNGLRDWDDTYNSTNNRLWPVSSSNTGAFCQSIGVGTGSTASEVGPNGSNGIPTLQTSCTSGGGGQVSRFNAVDGSLGYVDLATARNNNLAVTPTTTVGSRDDDKYITQLPNGSGAYAESTQQTNGFRQNVSTGGANCLNTTYENVPTSTLGDWSAVSGTDSNAGWGICTLTYALAFDDNATVYTTSSDDPVVEEARARTVKDYLFSSTEDSTQTQLDDIDYAAVPISIRALSQEGVDSIDWNKAGNSGGGGGGGGGGSTPPPAGGSAGGSSGGGGSTPPVVRPSNAFSVPRTSLSSKTGTATLSIRIPGPGTLVLEPTATVTTTSRRGKRKVTRSKKVKLGKVTRTVSKAGLVKITVKPTGSTLAALKKARKLKVSLKVSFTPKGGTRRTSTRTITLKYTKPKAKKKAGR